MYVDHKRGVQEKIHLFFDKRFIGDDGIIRSFIGYAENLFFEFLDVERKLL